MVPPLIGGPRLSAVQVPGEGPARVPDEGTDQLLVVVVAAGEPASATSVFAPTCPRAQTLDAGNLGRRSSWVSAPVRPS